MKIGPPFFLYRDISIYLESVCHGKQNGNQRIIPRQSIYGIWEFKKCKVEKDNEKKFFSCFKDGIWQSHFLNTAKNIVLFLAETNGEQNLLLFLLP